MTSHPAGAAPGAPRGRARVLPRDRLGWWAFGLLLAAATNPLSCWALWAATRFVDDPEATIRTGLTLAVAVPAVVVGSAALAQRSSRSLVHAGLAVVVALEIAWTVAFAVSFGDLAAGLAIAAGTAAGVLAGLLLARR
ncbi:MAG: hypothetical protein ACKOA9_02710 [Actinomycetota bacterium]